MTHNELLDEIGELMPNPSTIDYKTWSALRAVAELAGKDIEHESYVWLDGYDYAMKQIIQTIEKELK